MSRGKFSTSYVPKDDRFWNDFTHSVAQHYEDGILKFYSPEEEARVSTSPDERLKRDLLALQHFAGNYKGFKAHNKSGKTNLNRRQQNLMVLDPSEIDELNAENAEGWLNYLIDRSKRYAGDKIFPNETSGLSPAELLRIAAEEQTYLPDKANWLISKVIESANNSLSATAKSKIVNGGVGGLRVPSRILSSEERQLLYEDTLAAVVRGINPVTGSQVAGLNYNMEHFWPHSKFEMINAEPRNKYPASEALNLSYQENPENADQVHRHFLDKFLSKYPNPAEALKVLTEELGNAPIIASATDGSTQNIVQNVMGNVGSVG